MYVWTTTDFVGHYPVGTSAVVVAKTEEKARFLLACALEKSSIPQDTVDLELTKVHLDVEYCVILQDGDY